MNIFRKAVPFVLGIFLMAGTALAQGQQMQQQQTNAADSVSDAELEKFVKIAQKLQAIGEEVQSEAQELVNNEGMEFERFQKIIMSKQNPQMAQNVEVTEEEEKAIQNLQPELQKIQQEAQKKQMAAIQDSELSMQRFQQIAQAVQSDPQMMQRFQKMSSETAGSDSEGDGMN